MDVKYIIERLGGTTSVARECEVTPGAVSQWIRNGIPKPQLRYLRMAFPAAFVEIDRERRRAERRNTDRRK